MPRVNLNAQQREQRRFSDYVRGELLRQHKRQEDLADYIGIPRPSLTCRLNGRTDWKLPEVADVCEFFGEPYTIGREK